MGVSKLSLRRFAALGAAVAAFICALAPAAFADEPTANITNARTGATYTDLATATAEAKSGDTIKLGEGNYTLYKVNSEGHTKGKDLTFEGLGADKTAWNIGALVPDPAHYGTEYNSDYSFDGAGTVTFKNMTMRSAKADYLGFARINNTVLDGCVVNGKTFYWGYETAVFRNTTFSAPSGDYALWTYSSPVMTFDGCTFNASGKVINVYTDYSAGKHDITVNVNNCTFNSKSFLGFYKQALNINDSNMGNYKYILNITGSNKVTAERDNTTCSQLFGFGGKKANNSGRTDVNIDGELVWTAGKMQTHSYTDGEHDQAYKKTYTDWAQADKAGAWKRTLSSECNYCGWKLPDTDEYAYDVAYDLNGSTDEQTCDYATQKKNAAGATVKVKAAPVRKDYDFTGWNTAADGSGTAYEADSDLEVTEPVTLYAQWKKHEEPAPKPEPEPKPEPTPEPGDKGDTPKPGKTDVTKTVKKAKKSLPATGDTAMATAVSAVAIAALCLAGGLILKRRLG